MGALLMPRGAMNRKQRRAAAAKRKERRRENVIRPTHECFDDVTEFFNRLAVAGATATELEQFTIVHAICLRPPTGEPYAHGWIERDGFVIQAGIYEGRKIYYKIRRDDLLRSRVVWDETRYTVYEMIELEDALGFPPYRDEYRALCADVRPDRGGPKEWPAFYTDELEASR
jgi:hypothetical protein